MVSEIITGKSGLVPSGVPQHSAKCFLALDLKQLCFCIIFR